MRIGFNVKSLRFDSAAVRKALDRMTYRVFVRFGQYVRKVARHSIRSRRGPSRPGKPPHSQTGLLKAGIYYGWDAGERSVVIGPARLRGGQTYGSVTVPELLEYGGTVRVSGRAARRLGVRRGTRARYEARPYMQPAFEAGQARLDDFWAQTLKR